MKPALATFIISLLLCTACQKGRAQLISSHCRRQNLKNIDTVKLEMKQVLVAAQRFESKKISREELDRTIAQYRQTSTQRQGESVPCN